MGNYEYVQNPTHYNHDGRKECWDEWVDKYGVDYAVIICLGNVDKYLYRAGTKKGNSAEQDISKARMYMNKAAVLTLDYPDSIAVRTIKMYENLEKELGKYDTV